MFTQPLSSHPSTAANPPIAEAPQQRFAMFVSVTNPFFSRGQQARYLPNLWIVLVVAFSAICTRNIQRRGRWSILVAVTSTSTVAAPVARPSSSKPDRVNLP